MIGGIKTKLTFALKGNIIFAAGSLKVYKSTDGELLLEFTEESHNEKELGLLKYIYDVSLEQRGKLLERLDKK